MPGPSKSIQVGEHLVGGRVRGRRRPWGDGRVLPLALARRSSRGSPGRVGKFWPDRQPRRPILVTTVLCDFAAAGTIVATVVVGCTSLPTTPRSLTATGAAGVTGTA